MGRPAGSSMCCVNGCRSGKGSIGLLEHENKRAAQLVLELGLVGINHCNAAPAHQGKMYCS